MDKLRQFWGNLRSSFWFMPSLMVTGSIVFAVVLIEVDSANQWLSQWPQLFGVGVEVVAGLMMTVMCVDYLTSIMARLADRCIESSHDRAPLERRLLEVGETLETQSALCAGKQKALRYGY